MVGLEDNDYAGQWCGIHVQCEKVIRTRGCSKAKARHDKFLQMF